MLQTNLIFGIQKKIKEGSKGTQEKGMIEESTLIEETAEKTTEPILESSFIAGMYEKAAASKKKAGFKQVLITESFQIHKAQKKLEKDISYFNFLYENFVDDVFKDQFKELLESTLDDTVRLYQECDVTPRLISMTLDSNELNENQIVDIYKNRLNEAVKNNYTKPMLSGKITSLYENEIKDLTVKLIQEGSSIDMEQVKVYLPFEEAMYQFNKSILIPEIAASRVESFMESMTEEYKEFLEESAEDILASIEKKIRLLTSMIAPNMFEASVDAEGIEAPKMAGISIAVDKNFDDGECDEGEECPMTAISDDLEAQEEFNDDEEALGLEDEDIDQLTNDNTDPENIPAAEAESALDAGDDHELPIELDTDEGPAVLDAADNTNTNDDDVAISGQGQDHGIDDAVGTELPGGAEDVDVDLDSPVDTIEAKEDISDDIDEEELEDKEDVSEKDDSKKSDEDNDGVPDWADKSDDNGDKEDGDEDDDEEESEDEDKSEDEDESKED